MSTLELRRQIKKAVDRLPSEKLASVADYVHFVTDQPIQNRIVVAEKAIAAGRGVNWRKVRSDV